MKLKKWNGSSWVQEYPEVDVNSIVATGTPSSTTYLRGDGSWATVTAGGGDITSVVAGTGLSGGGTSGDVTLNLDFSELTDITLDVSGTTEMIVAVGATEGRKALSEIKLSAFNNDSGWTSNIGDITSVVAGTGLTGGGTSGGVTLNVDTSTIATQTYVDTAVANLVDSSPSTLDTLNELAAALGDDPNFATTVTNSIATKLPLAGGTLTGTLTTRAIAMQNYDITGINALSFNDPGPNEGISWNGGNFKIYESPNDLTTNSSGNLQFVSGGTRRMTVENNGNVYIGGGLTIEGSINSGAYELASEYEAAGTNIILKGDSSGRSGIFFQSERDGTNINHTSDFGYIQFHPYGRDGTSGESNELIIGVSNDSDDHLIFNAPSATGIKARVGSSGTDYTVWHSGNDGSGSGLSADNVDGYHIVVGSTGTNTNTLYFTT